MCVCLHVYMYVCTYTYTHVHVLSWHTYMYMYTHTHIHMYCFVHMYVRTYIYRLIHILSSEQVCPSLFTTRISAFHAQMITSLHVCMYAWHVQKSLHVRVYLYMYVRTYTYISWQSSVISVCPRLYFIVMCCSSLEALCTMIFQQHVHTLHNWHLPGGTQVSQKCMAHTNNTWWIQNSHDKYSGCIDNTFFVWTKFPRNIPLFTWLLQFLQWSCEWYITNTHFVYTRQTGEIPRNVPLFTWQWQFFCSSDKFCIDKEKHTWCMKQWTHVSISWRCPVFMCRTRRPYTFYTHHSRARSFDFNKDTTNTSSLDYFALTMINTHDACCRALENKYVLHVWMHTCTHTYLHVYTPMYVNAHMQVTPHNLKVFVHKCIHTIQRAHQVVYVFVHSYVHAYMHVHTCIYIYIHIYI